MEKFNFKPKDWVLVRDNNNQKWALAQYSHYDAEQSSPHKVLLGVGFRQCIPYDGNGRLLGTYNEYKERYVPKDGDFVYVEAKIDTYIFIKKEGDKTKKYILLNINNKELSSECLRCCCDDEIKNIRPATEEEKRKLLNALHREGKDWDAEHKKIVLYKGILDDKEREYLLSMLKPFLDRVRNIEKCQTSNGEFLHINMNDYIDTFNLPDFKKNTMYRNMELRKEYTPEELGLK